MSNFFYISPNLIFFKTNNAKIISLIFIFDVFLLLLLFLLLKSNFTKENISTCLHTYLYMFVLEKYFTEHLYCIATF